MSDFAFPKSRTSLAKKCMILFLLAVLTVAYIPAAGAQPTAAKASSSLIQQSSQKLAATATGLQSAMGNSPAVSDVSDESNSSNQTGNPNPVSATGGSKIWQPAAALGATPSRLSSLGGVEQPSYEFIANPNSSEVDVVTGSTVASDGSEYVVGATAVGNVIPSTSGTQGEIEETIVGAFLAKYSNAGQPDWIVRWSNAGTGKLSIATAGGYEYVVGSAFVNTNPSVPTSAIQVSVLAKFDSSGNLDWIRNWTQTMQLPGVAGDIVEGDSAYGVAVSPTTNMVYVIDNAVVNVGVFPFNITQPFLTAFTTSGNLLGSTAFPNCTYGSFVGANQLACDDTALNAIAVINVDGQDQVYVAGQEGSYQGPTASSIVGLYQFSTGWALPKIDWVSVFDFATYFDLNTVEPTPNSEITGLVVSPTDNAVYVVGSVLLQGGTLIEDIFSVVIDLILIGGVATCAALDICELVAAANAATGVISAYQYYARYGIKGVSLSAASIASIKADEFGFFTDIFDVLVLGGDIWNFDGANSYAFVAKLSYGGTGKWADTVGFNPDGNKNQEVSGFISAITANPAGGVYLAGNFTKPGGLVPGLNSGEAILSIDSSGNLLTQAVMGGTGEYSDSIAGLAVIPGGNLEIAGSANGRPTINFESELSPVNFPANNTDGVGYGAYAPQFYEFGPQNQIYDFIPFGGFLRLAQPGVLPTSNGPVLESPIITTAFTDSLLTSNSITGMYVELTGPAQTINFAANPSGVASFQEVGNGTSMTWLSVFPGTSIDVTANAGAPYAVQFEGWTSSNGGVSVGCACNPLGALVAYSGTLSANYQLYYGLSENPGTVTLLQPSSGSATSTAQVTVSQNFYIGTSPEGANVNAVFLSTSVAPTGASLTASLKAKSGSTVTNDECHFDGPNAAACIFTLTVTIPSSATPGTYAIVITANSGDPDISNAIIFAVTVLPSVTEQVTLMDNDGGPQAAFTVSGSCYQSLVAVSGNGKSQSLVAEASCPLSLSAPAPAGSQYILSGGSPTLSFTTCAAGTPSSQCTESSTYYYQLKNTYKATPTTPTSWDTILSIPVTGTQLGVAGATICTITTTNGGNSECQGYADYNTKTTVDSPVAVSSTEQWVESGGNSFTDKTAGNTNNVNYIQQFSVSIQVASGESTYGTVSAKGGWENEGFQEKVTASPAVGYSFTDWSGFSAITCSTSGCTPATSPTVTVTWSTGGTLTANFTPFPVKLSLVTAPTKVTAGSSTYAAIAVSGPAQKVTMSTESLPAGFSLVWYSQSVTDSPAGVADDLIISTAPSVAAGTYPVTVVGTGANGQTGSYTLSLTVAAASFVAVSLVQSCLNSVTTGTSTPTIICGLPSVTKGDLIVVEAYDTAASVTDSQGNSYTLVAKLALPGSAYDEYMFYSFTPTTGPDSITLTGTGASPGIIVHEFRGVTSVGVHSVGSGTSASPAVASFTPAFGSFLLAGAVVSGSNYGISAGSGYTFLTGNFVPMADEYLTTDNAATTSPFTLSSSEHWAEIALALEGSSVTVEQEIALTAQEAGAPSATFSLSGCDVSPSTIVGDGTFHLVTATPSCSITITVPADQATSRYRLTGGASSASLETCVTSVCTAASYEYYYLLQNSYQADAGAPSAWDGTYSIAITGTILGDAGTVCTITTASGAGFDTCAGWSDYNHAVNFPATVGSWNAVGQTSFTEKTGGSVYAVNYNRSSPLSVRVSQTGTSSCAGSTCTVTLTTTVKAGDILAVFVPGYSANAGWQATSVKDSLGNTFTSYKGVAWPTSSEYYSDNMFYSLVTFPGSSDIVTITFSSAATVALPVVLDVTGTGLAVSAGATAACTTSCGIIVATASTPVSGTYLAAAEALVDNGGTLSASDGWNYINTAEYYASAEYNTNVGSVSTTFPFSPSGIPSSWGDAGMIITASQPPTQVTVPISLTAQEAGAPTATFALSGCSVTPTSIAGDGGIHDVLANPSCSITVTAPTSTASTRYLFAGSASSTTVSTCAAGTCSEQAVAYYYELDNTYTASPGSPSTWDGSYSLAISGTVDGASATICTITTVSSGGAASCASWGDYDQSASFPTSVGGWTAQGTSTFTDTTGGNTHVVTYDKSSSSSISVSQTGYTDCIDVTSCTVSLASTVKVGDILLVFVPGYGHDGAWHAGQVTDSLGNSFTQYQGVNWVYPSASNFSDYAFYSVVTKGGTSDSITIDMTNEVTHSDPVVIDVTGSDLRIYGGSAADCTSACTVNIGTSATAVSGTYLAAGDAYGDLSSGLSAGSGFTKVSTADNYMTAEYSTNVGGSSTTFPFISSSTPRTWGDAGIVVVSSSSQVTQPIALSVQESGAPTGTFTLSGCDVTPTTVLGDGLVHDVVASPSCSITVTAPAAGANTRYLFAAASNTAILAVTCATGTCATQSLNYYYQLQNTYDAAPTSPSTWNGAYSISVTGTVSGSAATLCTIATSSGGGTAACSGWGDYDLTASFPSTVGSWSAQGTTKFTDTTGGNTHTVSYAESQQTTPQYIQGTSASGALGTSFSISWTNPFGEGPYAYVATYAGEYPPTSITSSPSVTWTQITPAGLHQNLTVWVASGDSASMGITLTWGKSTLGAMMIMIVSNADEVQPLDPAGPNILSGTAPSAIPISTTTSNADDIVLGVISWGSGGYPTTEGDFSNPIFGVVGGATASGYGGGMFGSIGASSNYNLNTILDPSVTISGGGTGAYSVVMLGIQPAPAAGYLVTKPISLAVQEAGAPTAAFTLSGCDVSPTSVAGDGAVHDVSASPSCTITVSAPLSSTNAGFNLTTGVTTTLTTCSSGTCSTQALDYYYQLRNTYEATPQSPTTWGGASTIAVYGTSLGASATICTISTTTGGGAAECLGWSDYDTPVSFPATATISGEVWDAQAPTSFTDTTGGNTNDVEYVYSVSTSFTDGQNASLVIGQASFTTSGYGTTQNSLSDPVGLAFDSHGDLWVSEQSNNRVLEFVPPFYNGMPASLVIGQSSFTTRVAATTQTGLNNPWEITFDSSGDLWVTDIANNRVLEFVPPFYNGMPASVVIGQSSFTQALQGRSQSGIFNPHGIGFDSQGDLWITDYGNDRVLEFVPPFSSGMDASLVIGQSSFTTDQRLLTAYSMNSPWGLTFDSHGDLWVSDTGNSRVLEFVAPFSDGMSASLVIGQPGFTTSTPGLSQSGIYYPSGIAFDSSGNLWAVDQENNRVLEFMAPFSDGMSASVVLGQSSFSTNTGTTSQSGLYVAADVAIDSSGNVWVTDDGNNRVLEFVPGSNPAAPLHTGPLVAAQNVALITRQSPFFLVRALHLRVLGSRFSISTELVFERLSPTY